MRNTCVCWIIFGALAATFGCRSPSPDWNGQWKLNPSKGNFQGPVFSITISQDGEYRFIDGSSSFSFYCDGRARPIGKNRTEACVKGSASTLDLTRKENGVKTNVYHWELSSGGRFFTSTATAYRGSSPAVTGQIVASRMSGLNDFAGQWRDTRYLQRHADLTLRLDRHTLHMNYPSAGQYVDAPFDGIDVPAQGPHAPEGLTYSARPAGRRAISILSKRNGKILDQTTLELSSDGKVITELWWNPGHPMDKGRLVYDKQ